MNEQNTTMTRERLDLIESLQTQRRFLCQTAAGLTDEQARHRSTASDLTIGGIIKHVAQTELGWAGFMNGEGLPNNDVDWADPDPAAVEAYQNGMVLLLGESLEEVLDEYARIAAVTDELVLSLDLDAEFRLPDAPWFPPDTSWSVRRAALHIVGETAQHAGHADVIRESIDGQKTMG